MSFLTKFYKLTINKIPSKNSSKGVIKKLRIFILKNVFNKIGDR